MAKTNQRAVTATVGSIAHARHHSLQGWRTENSCILRHTCHCVKLGCVYDKQSHHKYTMLITDQGRTKDLALKQDNPPLPPKKILKPAVHWKALPITQKTKDKNTTGKSTSHQQSPQSYHCDEGWRCLAEMALPGHPHAEPRSRTCTIHWNLHCCEHTQEWSLNKIPMTLNRICVGYRKWVHVQWSPVRMLRGRVCAYNIGNTIFSLQMFWKIVHSMRIRCNAHSIKTMIKTSWK